MSFLYFQRPGGDRTWHLAPAAQRQKIIAEEKPAYVTVLDLMSVPEDDWTRDEFNKIRYAGPWYGDWDANDLSLTIKPFQQFLKKLEDNKVNLKSLRLYATGGRGFHVEIPEVVYNPKPTKAGVTLLPHILRGMAYELSTEYMDMLVYSAKKGRMWRCPGVEREKDGKGTGKYKVPLTVEQAMAMTPEMYDTLTTSPWPEPIRDEPVGNSYLYALFDQYKIKVEETAKRAIKSRGDVDLLARFQGQFPPSIKKLMSGEGVDPKSGFNKIGIQLSLAAHALKKSQEDFVKECEGLIQNHQSDGERYNSPRKRREELRRIYDYMSGDSVYEYSRGGMRSITAPGVSLSDLDSEAERASATFVKTEDMTPEMKSKTEAASSRIFEGMFLSEKGIWRKAGDSEDQLCTLSFDNPNKLLDLDDGTLLGLEVDMYSDGVHHGRQHIPMTTFKSRALLNDFCMARSGVFKGTDTQASLVQLLLSRLAVKSGNITYIIRKEGMELIQDPSERGSVKRHVVWVCPDAVSGNTESTVYRYMSVVAKGPVFNTDLHTVKGPLENTKQVKDWLHALLAMNEKSIIGLMLGWFVSCFHKQFYQAAFDQFPLLHPNGPAGCGKTFTTKLLARMFYNTSPVVMLGASAATNFALKAAWTASASIPLVIDEYKPSELPSQRYDFLLQHFRMAYNQGAGASGGMSKGSTESSFRDVTQYNYSAPTVYIGESQEMQTAIVQRTVSVALSSTESGRHTKAFNLASSEENLHLISRLGFMLMTETFNETVTTRRETLAPIRDMLRAKLGPNTHDRQVYNLAVVICGLNFLERTLEKVFGTEFRSEIEEMITAIIDRRDEITTHAVTESSKVLNDLALMSHSEKDDSEFAIREGYEYLVNIEDDYIEITAREAFIKYAAWCHRKGFRTLYTTAEGFIASLAKSPATLDPRVFETPLLLPGQSSRILRLSLEKLKEEGVDLFKTKSLA
jgi:hypothetical protein